MGRQVGRWVPGGLADEVDGELEPLVEGRQGRVLLEGAAQGGGLIRRQFPEQQRREPGLDAREFGEGCLDSSQIIFME